MRAAIRLVWALGVRHLVAYRLRLALSAFGVASGVALAISVSSFDSSIQASLHTVASASASKANLEVRGMAGVGVPEIVASELRSLEGVRAAGAAMEAFTPFRSGDRQERALLLGIDQDTLELAPGAVRSADLGLRDPLEAVERQADDSLGADVVFERHGLAGVEELFRKSDTDQPTGPLGLFVPAGLARRLDVKVGGTIEVSTGLGWQTVLVGGVVPSSQSTGTRAVVGALDEVQELFARPGSVDVVYVEAASVDEAAEVQRVVGNRGRVGPAAFREQEVRRLLASATVLLRLSGLVALFVGAFLVFNTMSMAAVERTAEAALLRAVGARRRQVFGLFCAEGALLGVLGSAVGVFGGTMLARVIFFSRSSALKNITPIDVTRFAVRPTDLVVAGVLGFVAALIASLLPARRVARSDPALALGPSGTLEEPGHDRIQVGVVVVGTTLVAAGTLAIVMLIVNKRQEFALWGLSIAMSGLALLIRPGIPAVARILLAPLAGDRSRAPGIVRLAAGEVLRAPGRTAFTVGAVLLALTIVVGVTLGTTSFSRTFETSFEQILSADLYVRSATWRPFGSDVPLDASLAESLEKVPGVQFALPFRATTGALDGRPIVVLAYDQQKNARLPGLNAARRREFGGYAEKLSSPNSVLVSPSTLITFGYRIGQELSLPAPRGVARLRIAGTLLDPSAVTPSVYLEWSEFRRIWETNGADNFPLALEPGADRDAVKRDIERLYGPTFGVQVDTREQYQQRVNGLVGSFTGLVSSLLLVVVVTAGLGLANTLIISTLERRRDLGVLRAVGMQRSQVRRMVAIEAVIVGAIGVGFAWVLGTGLGFLMGFGLEAQLGLPIDFSLTSWAYVQGALLGVGGAVLAAVYPAHRAASVDVVDALQYE